jgi:hypothetical protein
VQISEEKTTMNAPYKGPEIRVVYDNKTTQNALTLDKVFFPLQYLTAYQPQEISLTVGIGLKKMCGYR